MTNLSFLYFQMQNQFGGLNLGTNSFSGMVPAANNATSQPGNFGAFAQAPLPAQAAAKPAQPGGNQDILGLF